MTEPTEPDAPADAGAVAPLDPAVEAAVRRTLAAASGPEPMPAGVAARLDGVIGGLVVERTASGATVSHPEDPGIVVPLDAAARRRRVRVRALLGAAAAVVAVGAGAGIINSGARDDRGDAATATSDEAPARDEGGAAADELQEGAPGAASDGQAEVASPSASPSPQQDDTRLKRVTVDEQLRPVRPDHLREDLVALQHFSLPHPAAADYSQATLTAPADFVCEPAGFGRGYLVGVLYDDRPAVVAFREPVGSNQAAEVLACGTGDVLHSTILAAS